jgi:hypothetical protein
LPGRGGTGDESALPPSVSINSMDQPALALPGVSFRGSYAV